MPASDKSIDSRTARNPLPPKLAALVRESSWLAFLALALYLLLVLWTFDRADPGWSHSSAVEHIANSGGVIGAYVSDLLLFLFGLSAYWWVILCAALVLWGFRRIEVELESDRRS
ncbi:MAG: DNA translocase FtsK 4TM domain-containing protein, partial [Betaproteobacteria bacterium]